MSRTELQTRIAQLERRIHIAEIQNARPITLELLCDELWNLKRELGKVA
jgi:hypothetical protein